MYQDKYLVCKDCGSEFLFSASEQEYYASKGFQNEPGRCLECRRARKQQRGGGMGNSRPRMDRPMYEAVCAACGQQTTIPFEPTNDRPVYCRDCYRARQNRYR